MTIEYNEITTTSEFSDAVLLDIYKGLSEVLFDALFELREAYQTGGRAYGYHWHYADPIDSNQSQSV